MLLQYSMFVTVCLLDNVCECLILRCFALSRFIVLADDNCILIPVLPVAVLEKAEDRGQKSYRISLNNLFRLIL